jgi:xanthine dehydrogenase accessory factor
MTLTLAERTLDNRQRSRVYTDNVIPHLSLWATAGEKCALVTLVGVDGNAPRAVGAQMAVSETGKWAGYISGGCLEQAIALEAVEVIKSGHARLIRYGKGSPYFDIKLPCGSGLDILIQPFHDEKLIGEMERHLTARQPFALQISVEDGASAIERLPARSAREAHGMRDGDTFRRAYTPAVRCLIIGTSPIAAALAELAVCSGFDAVFHVPDLEAAPPLPQGVMLCSLVPGTEFAIDGWTAAILAFHDHEQELPIFSALLGGPCFFIGAIGSRNAHEARKRALSEAGFADEVIACIKSPAGLLPGLKTAPYVAVSILAEVVAAARDQRLIT